jgi:hypothetical protein
MNQQIMEEIQMVNIILPVHQQLFIKSYYNSGTALTGGYTTANR